MSKTAKQMERELHMLKEQLSTLSAPKAAANEGGNVHEIIKLLEEYKATNKALLERVGNMTTQVAELKRQIQEVPVVEEEAQYEAPRREVALSKLDAQVLGYVQSKEMVCADEVKEVMKYRGRNAACARLNMLRRQGLLDRFQLGHKVYYKYDAGKATNILIISPPQ